MTSIVQQALTGNRRALARLLTYVENQDDTIQEILNDLYTHTGNAHVIGVTGAPGTGKSTLVSAIATEYRKQDKTVAILAVDPTSPFTGGAVLGDRIRMNVHTGDKGVFIRSMATRGQLGGLAYGTQHAIWVLDAAGYDIILVETVGAGQSEVEIVRAAHTTLVLEAPGLGDGVQSIKAGILEIADILVVNKADRPGATNTTRTLRAMLELGHPTKTTHTGHHGHQTQPVEKAQNGHMSTMWIPPVHETVATEQKGVDELVTSIEDHHKYLDQHNLRQNRQQPVLTDMLHQHLQQALLSEFLAQVPQQELDDLQEKILTRKLSPQQASDQMLITYNKR